MNLRRVVSLSLLISLFFLIFTSIILYLVPQGRVAYWADWHFWGLSKTEWANLHINLGVFFILAGFFHTFYNWQVILNYLKDKKKNFKIFNLNFNVAFFLTLFFILGTYFYVPPFSSIINLSEIIKEQGALKYGEPPYGHAELSSLKIFSKRMGLDLQESINLLKSKGVSLKNENQTLAEISRENNLTPQQVYTFIKGEKREGEEKDFLSKRPPLGFGRKTLEQICEQNNLDLKIILQNLSELKIKSSPAQTIKEIAAENELDVSSVFEIIAKSKKKN